MQNTGGLIGVRRGGALSYCVTPPHSTGFTDSDAMPPHPPLTADKVGWRFQLRSVE